MTKKESNEGKERGREGKRDKSGRFACLHAHIFIISKAFWEEEGRVIIRRVDELKAKNRH